MSSFIIDLWESIFTPGPTPTILYATNLSFGALQLVLLALLLATSSIHFVVLSVLCGGLWWAINWFARELAVAQGLERQGRSREPAPKRAEEPDGSSDTEVETTAATGREGDKEERAEDLRYRGVGGQEGRDASVSQSSGSTEDEWEKVSGGERDKAKGE